MDIGAVVKHLLDIGENIAGVRTVPDGIGIRVCAVESYLILLTEDGKLYVDRRYDSKSKMVPVDNLEDIDMQMSYSLR